MVYERLLAIGPPQDANAVHARCARLPAADWRQMKSEEDHNWGHRIKRDQIAWHVHASAAPFAVLSIQQQPIPDNQLGAGTVPQGDGGRTALPSEGESPMYTLISGATPSCSQQMSRPSAAGFAAGTCARVATP